MTKEQQKQQVLEKIAAFVKEKNITPEKFVAYCEAYWYEGAAK